MSDCYKYEITCISCGKLHQAAKYSSRGLYCSNTCQRDHDYKIYIAKWLAGEESGLVGRKGFSRHIRRYVFEKFDSKCCKCGWDEKHPSDGKIPLEVDHIDGQHSNMHESNLRLLCPNCHSLTSTYKSRNRGKSTRNYTLVGS